MELKRAFGGWHLTNHAWIRFNGHAQGATECLINSLDDVMRIAAAQGIDMHGYLGVVGEALEKFVEQINVEIADPSAWKFNVIFETWAA